MLSSVLFHVLLIIWNYLLDQLKKMSDQFYFCFLCFLFSLIWVSTKDTVSLHLVPLKVDNTIWREEYLKIFLVIVFFKLECEEVWFRIGQDKAITVFFFLIQDYSGREQQLYSTKVRICTAQISLLQARHFFELLHCTWKVLRSTFYSGSCYLSSERPCPFKLVIFVYVFWKGGLCA